jgi:hypothetical protein
MNGKNLHEWLDKNHKLFQQVIPLSHRVKVCQEYSAENFFFMWEETSSFLQLEKTRQFNMDQTKPRRLYYGATESHPLF